MGHGGGWAEDVSPGGEIRSGLLGSCRDKAKSTQRNSLASPPCTWGAAGRRRADKGARPLLDKDADGPAADSQSPSGRKPAPSAGLAASLHSGPRSRSLAPAGRGVRTRGAPGAWGTRVCASPWPPLGGAAALGTPHPRLLRRGLGHRTQRGPAGQGRGAARSGRPKAGAGWLRVPQIPRPFSKCPPRAPLAPCPPPQPSGTARPRRSRSVLGGCGRVGLGPGAGLGADPEAGLSLRQGPVRLPPVSVSPPPSSCSGRSPAWGGRRPAGQVR